METKTYGCLVVDDEPIARKIIISYIEQMPMLRLAGECINALEAIEYLRTHEIDILFLDINMPHLSGLQLLKIIQPHQPAILTTAYTEFAVESYDVNAIDYLLKPFSFERFTKATYKAISKISIASKNTHEQATEQSPQIFIKSDGKNYPVFLHEILYCEAMKNYTMVRLYNGQKLMPLIPLSKFETLLAEKGGDFIQIHRSFLISRRHIASVTPTLVTINKFELPVGIQYREAFLQMIGMKGGA